MDRDVATAWHTAAFYRMKRLKPLRSYLQRARRQPPEPTQAERTQIIAAAQRFADQLRTRLTRR